MPTPQEPDFPPGHPARFDYDPDSPEAKEWTRTHVWLPGERDFPVGHPKAVDTPGNQNAVRIEPGVDPDHPELEPFTGRRPEVVARIRELNAELAAQQMPTPEREPIEAPPPPKNPGSTVPPSGQPGLLSRILGK